MATIAVLGAGLLGSGMVENLLAKGERVVVWNRTAAKLAPLVEKGAAAAPDAASAVAGADRVHLVLTADDAVDATIAALRPGLAAGTPILDHSTNLPDRVAERYARLRSEGVHYLHAPVFMSPQNARGAGGIMLVAGPKEEVDALTPALQAMTGRVWHVGERPELAAIQKLFGNGVLVALAATMGDLFAIGAAQGISPSDVLQVFEVFKPGHGLPSIGSRVASAGTVPASFELAMARKDVGLMIAAAGGPEGLVVLPGIAQAMDEALEAGLGEEDFAVFAWPRRRARA
ncbi:MAG: NAD(P)-binding domain-containing protein [Pseudomonadota bacterium]|nr:NAD(P)-binding domain-containing protein [Pseudomonadota bacterium]